MSEQAASLHRRVRPEETMSLAPHCRSFLIAASLLLGACQSPLNLEGQSRAVRPMIAGEISSPSLTGAARSSIDHVVSTYMRASDQQGMIGVTAAIDECYVKTISTLQTTQNVRDCLVLDMLAFRIDHQMSSGEPGGSQQLSYFRRNVAERRWDRYAPLGNLRPGEEAARFMTNGSEAALYELGRRRNARRVS